MFLFRRSPRAYPSWRDHRDAAVPSSSRVRLMLLSRNVTALDQPARTRVMAPESCVTVEELPGGGVELVGRDKAGVVRMRMECERVEAVVRWSIKVVRLGLAVHYDAGESGIRLLGS